jgi:hypothetical protein
MKTKIVLAVLFAGILAGRQSNAAQQSVNINWLGNGGSRVLMSMSYDDAFPIVSALGDHYNGGTATNVGISQLSLHFLVVPSALHPAYSVQDISNNVVMYRFLRFTFDTVSLTLSGQLDVGKDTFGEGLPGSSTGEYYLSGPVSSPSLVDPNTGQTLDSGGAFTITPVPEPSTWALVAAGLALMFLFRSPKRSATVVE